jgi:Tol biopolymer transport system component
MYFVAFSQEIRSVWKVDVDPRTLEPIAGPHRVTAMTDSTALALTRDGRRMAFDSADRRSRIATYPLDVTGRHIIGPPKFHSGEAETASVPDLTRDGTRLLFQSDLPGNSSHVHSLRVKDLTDGSDRVLASADIDRGEDHSDLRWSPDGTAITFRNHARTEQGGRSESIWVLDPRTGKSSQVTSPTTTMDIPYGWSDDGRFVVASSRRYKPGYFTIALVPLSAQPMAEREAIFVTEHKDFGLWNSSMSPDGRWICFNATRTMSISKIVVVRATGGRWIELTDGTSWDDKPRWSPDGRLLYFISNRGGLFNVWAIEFASREGTPRGDPFPVTRFGGKEGIVGIYVAEIGIGIGRLALPISNASGGLWVIDNMR